MSNKTITTRKQFEARKAELQSKITALQEAKASNGLAYLIESELEKAEVLLVAKSVVDKLQKTAEDIAKIEGTDIIPAMEALKAAYGPNLADSFQSVSSEQLRATVAAITQAKDAISTAVAKFEGVLNGEQPGNDMGAELDAPDMGADDLDADAGLDADMGADMGADAGADTGADDLGDDTLDTELDAAFDADADAGSTSAAGRAKKESAAPRGRMVREGEFVKAKKGENPFAKKGDKLCDEEKCDKDEKAKAKAKKDEKLDETTDARILRAFRSKIREGVRAVPAARAIAASFGVDLQDVVAIISETRLGK